MRRDPGDEQVDQATSSQKSTDESRMKKWFSRQTRTQPAWCSQTDVFLQYSTIWSGNNDVFWLDGAGTGQNKFGSENNRFWLTPKS
jgi:hypothetical protein